METTIRIDWADDENPDKPEISLSACCKKFNVSYKIIQEYGPGGGWPEVNISGTHENVKAFYTLYAGDDLDFDDFIVK